MKAGTGVSPGVDTSAITVERLIDVLVRAGRKVGIGAPYPERRRRLGWFRVESVEIVKVGRKERVP